MALQKDMQLWQIKKFLEDEFKEQIFLEVSPILYIGQEVGGYFGVTRHILCLLEFLGALYCGYNGKSKYPNGAKKIAQGDKTLKFMKELLKDIDKKYAENGKYLYAMYRHGLVHLYQPRTIKLKNGKELKWAAYKGSRENVTISFSTDQGTFTLQDVKHLDIVGDPRNQQYSYLTISITCLYKDFLTSIDIYYRLLEQNKNLLKNWQETANAILEAEDLIID